MSIDTVAGELTVGQLASRTGVRAGTVRYYEREGLAETFVTSLTSASASFFHSGSAYVKCAAWLAGVGQV